MSSDKYKYISDAELHRRLLENGFPNIAVTETTRNILIQKLEKCIKKSKQQTKANMNNQSGRHNSPLRNLYSLQNGKEIQYTANILKKSNIDFTRHRNKFSDNTTKNAFTIPYRDMDATNRRLSEKNTHQNNDFKNLLNHHGMVNRLLSFRGMLHSDIYNKLTSKLQYTKQERNNCLKPPKQSNYFVDLYLRLKMSYTIKQEIIPPLLIVVLLTFFVLLGFVYVSTTPTRNIIEYSTTKYNICSESNEISNGLKEYFNCITKDELHSALAVINEVYLHLINSTKTLKCANVKPIKLNAIKMTEIIDLWSIILSIEYLITSNPEWNLVITDASGLLTNIKENDISISNVYISLSKHRLPKICIFHNKMHKFFFIIGIGTIIGLVFIALFFLKKYITSKYNQKRSAVNFFTTEILNSMLHLNNNSDCNYLIINHLRDKLMVENSTKYLHAFNEALRLLKLRDNRLQFGLTIFNGEEVEIIKWTNGGNSDSNYNLLEKKWQSPAFDNINKILNPPTPCLKIRHMFDFSEVDIPNLEEIIKNAIKYKVGSRCPILNINVDKKTCCVYVRCASNSDAGIVHNEINGWWFDMRLVSIKFLRLQRYLSRFPDSPQNIT